MEAPVAAGYRLPELAGGALYSRRDSQAVVTQHRPVERFTNGLAMQNPSLPSSSAKMPDAPRVLASTFVAAEDGFQMEILAGRRSREEVSVLIGRSACAQPCRQDMTRGSPYLSSE